MRRQFTDVLDLTEKDLRGLEDAVGKLHAWYRSTARDLPWRRSRDPYAIWVSEVMLQQTRVDAVVPYFTRWMTRLPEVATLAAADEHDVLKLWEGLGYYRRARNLHRAAQVVVEEHGGSVPRDYGAFRSLPGVGAYTAAAVLSIAFDANLAVVDGNVKRVLTRLTACPGEPARAPFALAIEALAGALLPTGTAATHNQAVMELGATVCTPRNPRCAECPLTDGCRGLATGNPDSFPARTKKALPPHHDVAIGIVVRDGQVFIDRRRYGGLLGGLWEFPGGKVESGETVEQALVRELREEFGMAVEIADPLDPVRHAYSHLRVTLHPRLCRFRSMDDRVGEGRPWKWVRPEELTEHPMPRANRKIIEGLIQDLVTGTGFPALRFVPEGAPE